MREKPGFSRPFWRKLQTVAKHRSGWLSSQDSNCDIPRFETAFEIPNEFRAISKKSRAGDFRNYISDKRECGRPFLFAGRESSSAIHCY